MSYKNKTRWQVDPTTIVERQGSGVVHLLDSSDYNGKAAPPLRGAANATLMRLFFYFNIDEKGPVS